MIVGEPNLDLFSPYKLKPTWPNFNYLEQTEINILDVRYNIPENGVSLWYCTSYADEWL